MIEKTYFYTITKLKMLKSSVQTLPYIRVSILKITLKLCIHKYAPSFINFYFYRIMHEHLMCRSIKNRKIRKLLY